MRNSNNLALLALLFSTLPGLAQFGQGVAAGSWEPLAIRTKAGIVADWNPAQLSMVTLNGNGVSQLMNRLPNATTNTHLVQATAINQPLYNTTSNTLAGGRATMYFDGSAYYLKTAAFTWNQPEQMIMGFLPWTWTLNDRLMDGNTLNTMLISQAPTTPNHRLYAGVDSTAVSFTLGTWAVATTAFVGANSYLQNNNAAAVTSNAGTSNAGGFTLGANATPGNYGNVQVSRVIGCSKTNSLPELQYLKWGLLKNANVL